MLKSLQDCLSSLTGRPDDSVEGWDREDLPPHRYKCMHSPSDRGDAMELYRKRAPKWKGHLLQSLHEDGTPQGRTYDTLMSVMKDACDFPRGSLRRVAEGAPQYKPRYTLLKRSMEITPELDPSMRLSCALLLDQAIGYRIGDVTEYRSELFDPETYYGHYFINGKDSNGKPTIRAIGHRWEFLDWKEGGEGALDMDGEGKSSNGKYGWQNAGKMTSWLGGRVNWGERAPRSPRRDADGDSFTKWQESGECTGFCEDEHKMHTHQLPCESL